jgi:hypothetical protein
MYCKSCLQVNPLPRCVEQGGEIILTGLTFPDYTNTSLYAILWDHSMNRQIMWTITTDGTGEIIETDGVASTGLNITDAYNLMGHAYEIEFTNTNLEPVLATVDGQTGCCIKFTTLKPLVGNGEIELSTGTCNA